jgi:hypothetical protein
MRDGRLQGDQEFICKIATVVSAVTSSSSVGSHLIATLLLLYLGSERCICI